MPSMPFTLQLQSVVYGNDLDAIEKLIESTSVAAANAKKQSLVSRVVHRIGDCTESPIISDPDVWCKEHSTEDIDVEYYFFDENLGHGGGQNRLAENSDADVLGIVNPDVVVSPQLISILCNELADDSVGIAEAAQIPLEHPKEYDPLTRETTFASGCCFFISRELFSEVNGFDSENFFMYCDDVDFSWRVRLLGKRIVFTPNAFVYHDHRLNSDGTLQVGNAEFYYSALGAVMLAYKWNRSDLADQMVASLRKDEKYGDVIQEIDQIIASGKLPAPQPGAKSVAYFDSHGFAHYRWIH